MDQRILTEQQLINKINEFTRIHKDGSIDITDEVANDNDKLTLLLTLRSKNRKYKLQYKIE
jgi:hypothetical protein